jgi:diguanylate cyclase (GGDEF) domain
VVNLVYAEINAFGIFVLLLMIISIKRNLTLQYGEKLFIALLSSIVIMLVIDALTWLLDGVTVPYTHAALVIINTLFFALLGVICFCWLLYFDYRINGSREGLRQRAVLYAVPCVSIELLVLINIFTGWIFYIDADNVYIRGNIFVLFTTTIWILMFIPAIMTITHAIHEPLRYRRREFIMEALYIMPPLAGWILQYVFNIAPLLWILTVASLLICFIDMQSRQISLDALTGINNRRTFNRYIETFIDNPKQKNSLALFMLDVNDFKNINDTCGHVAGDDALIRFASVLKKVCGYCNCFLARYGGDEFAVVCSDLDEEHLDMLEAKIKQEIDKDNDSVGERYKITCSIGRSKTEKFEASDIENLIAEADRDMYYNKGLYKTLKTSDQNK